MKLKVIYYNIKYGFHDRDKNENFVLNKKRLISAQKIIKKENPDILVICEANFTKGSFSKTRQDYGKIFGYKYWVVVSSSFRNFEWGNAILSKYPIIKSKKAITKNTRFLNGIVSVRGQLIELYGIHPNPYASKSEKLALIKKTFGKTKNSRIVAGDFNSLSPRDKHDKAKLIDNFSKKFNDKKKAQDLVKEMLKFKTIRLILKNDLLDTFMAIKNKWDYTYHTKLSGNNYVRIDYIFCSKDIKVIDSGIIKNKLTEMASDHYPIYAVLEI